MLGKKMRKACSLGFLLVVGAICSVWLFGWFYLAQPTPFSAPPSEVRVDAAQLERHVRILSEDFVPRNASHIGNINRTADYIGDKFRAIGSGQVSEQWFETGSYRYRNVSLIFGDPNSERTVIGAHYDGYGRYPGADDNASGVAGLIELAKLISDHPLKSTVELVGYPLEEPPYFGTSEMGSYKHVEYLRKSEISCRYMISLEMIGYFTDEPASQSYPVSLLHWYYPEKGNFITIVGNTENRQLTRRFKSAMKGTSNLPVRSICAPASIPGIDFSDHRNYWHRGIPAIMITDTAFYRNTAYHTPDDTADRLDYKKMAQVVVGVFEGLKKLDQ